LVAASPYQNLFTQIILESAQEGEDLLVPLEPCGKTRVEGIVLSASGAPLPGTPLVISRTAEGVHRGAGSVTADGSGRFLIEGLLPGAVYDLCPALYLEVVVPPADATLDGVVMDREGRPIPGLSVFYDYLKDELPVSLVTVTREDGRFSVPGVFPGKYLVRISSPGFGFAWAEVDTSEGGREFFLERTRKVRLHLVQPDGFPVAAIYLSGEAGEAATPKRMLHAEDGLYEFEVPLGETAVKVRAYLHDPEAKPELRFSLGQPTRGVLDLGTVTVEDSAAGTK
jgi:hypothetical protein